MQTSRIIHRVSAAAALVSAVAMAASCTTTGRRASRTETETPAPSSTAAVVTSTPWIVTATFTATDTPCANNQGQFSVFAYSEKYTAYDPQTTPVTGAGTFIEVLDAAGTPVPDATVTMNGAGIPYLAGFGFYYSTTFLPPGAATPVNCAIAHPTLGTAACSVPFPGAASFTTPAAGTTWSASSPNTATWTNGSPRTLLQLYSDHASFGGPLPWLDFSGNATSFTFPAGSLAANTNNVANLWVSLITGGSIPTALGQGTMLLFNTTGVVWVDLQP